MRELLIAAAKRAIRYQEGLNERSVAPDPTVVARLTELDVPLPDRPSSADETLALLVLLIAPMHPAREAAMG